MGFVIAIFSAIIGFYLSVPLILLYLVSAYYTFGDFFHRVPVRLTFFCNIIFCGSFFIGFSSKNKLVVMTLLLQPLYWFICIICWIILETCQRKIPENCEALKWYVHTYFITSALMPLTVYGLGSYLAHQ